MPVPVKAPLNRFGKDIVAAKFDDVSPIQCQKGCP
jgi:hypothetical protein